MSKMEFNFKLEKIKIEKFYTVYTISNMNQMTW